MLVFVGFWINVSLITFVELQGQLDEQKVLHSALNGEMKTVKDELQQLQHIVVEDESLAAKLRM